MDKLSRELLENVFYYSLQPVYGANMAILDVSKLWNTIARARSSLWKTVTVRLEEDLQTSVSKMRLALELGGKHPIKLLIHVGRDVFCERSFPDWATQPPLHLIRALTACTEEHIGRVTHLTIVIHNHMRAAFLVDFFDSLALMDAPQLQCLQSNAEMVPSRLASNPRLTAVHSLYILSFDHIQHLSLELNMDLEFEWVKLASLKNVRRLGLYANLCQFYDMLLLDDVEMPNVHTLDVAGDLTYWFQHLFLPNLVTINVHDPRLLETCSQFSTATIVNYTEERLDITVSSQRPYLPPSHVFLRMYCSIRMVSLRFVEMYCN